MRTATAVGRTVVVVTLLAGCIAIGRDDEGNGASDPSIEELAWSGAGVDAPTFEVVGSELRIGVDTSLPIHEDEENGLGFADRAAQIAWRTHPGRFASMQVTVLHDGDPVMTVDFERDELEALFGPRPDGLDEGVARASAAPAIDGELADVTEGVEPVVGDVRDEVLTPIVERTFAEFLGIDGVEVFGTEPEECLGGINGDQPTGEFRADTGARVTVDGYARALLPGIAEYWRELGLEVSTDVLDGGLHSVSASLDGLGTVLASASERSDTLRVHGLTRCLAPA